MWVLLKGLFVLLRRGLHTYTFVNTHRIQSCQGGFNQCLWQLWMDLHRKRPEQKLNLSPFHWQSNRKTPNTQSLLASRPSDTCLQVIFVAWLSCMSLRVVVTRQIYLSSSSSNHWETTPQDACLLIVHLWIAANLHKERKGPFVGKNILPLIKAHGRKLFTLHTVNDSPWGQEGSSHVSQRDGPQKSALAQVLSSELLLELEGSRNDEKALQRHQFYQWSR